MGDGATALEIHAPSVHDPGRGHLRGVHRRLREGGQVSGQLTTPDTLQLTLTHMITPTHYQGIYLHLILILFNATFCVRLSGTLDTLVLLLTMCDRNRAVTKTNGICYLFSALEVDDIHYILYRQFTRKLPRTLAVK